MNLKTKSKILSILMKIAAYITVIFFICIYIRNLPKSNFSLQALSFIVLIILSELTFVLLDCICDENWIYEHLLKVTSEEKLLAKGFEYVIASLYLEFNVESIEIDGEKVSYSEDKEKFKKLLKQNDKVTVFCHLINQDRWVFWSISNKEKRYSREQLVSFELPSKKLLKKIKKRESLVLIAR